MAKGIFKKLELPLLEWTTDTEPPPKAPDPLQNTFFGLKDYGGSGLVPWIYRYGNDITNPLKWYIADTNDLLANIPPYQNKSTSFYSESDSFGVIEDMNILGREVLKIDFPSDFYLTDVFQKPINSDTIINDPGYEIPPSTNCLLTLAL